ncbi:hypothetical protein [Microbacterium capsulatum]|uniref:Uncharacterized protein n=1 Tax=Microbacterium capsulatum TaxID=3041921 RepID=A0ABU0XEK5_9MICO|nr:hypothetical protein [Microbacterium sp. ASV81]MDQ4213537.1 hypothetical protein [Microbacterium sp. ASV81]
MNEVQGPTPTGTSRPYKSLVEALRGQRIDPVNYEFIGAIVDAVGISSLIDRGRYIEAIRRVPGTALHIGRTYTNGFAEDEQIVVGGRILPLLPSEGRAPYFYVIHPSELPGAPVVAQRAPRTRTAGTRAPAKPKPEPRAPKATPREDRDYGVCDVCFMVKTPSGGCGCD